MDNSSNTRCNNEGPDLNNRKRGTYKAYLDPTNEPKIPRSTQWRWQKKEEKNYREPETAGTISVLAAGCSRDAGPACFSPAADKSSASSDDNFQQQSDDIVSIGSEESENDDAEQVLQMNDEEESGLIWPETDEEIDSNEDNGENSNYGSSDDSENEDIEDGVAGTSCEEQEVLEDFTAGFEKISNAEIDSNGVTYRELTVLLLSVLVAQSSTDKLKTSIFDCLNTAFNVTEFPANQYSLKCLYKPILSKVSYHLFCKDCNLYVGVVDSRINELTCPGCSKIVKKSEKEANFFISNNISRTIKNIFEKTSPSCGGKFSEEPSVDNIIRDVADGTVHKELRSSRGPDILTYNLFGDGAPPFKNSKYGMWAMMLAPNFLDLSTRFRSVRLVSIWVGRGEPKKLHAMMEPLCRDAHDAAAGVNWTDHNGVPRASKVVPLFCIADSMGRFKLQGMNPHNGAYGCGWCYHPNFEESQAYNRYTIGPIMPALRTDESWMHDLEIAEETGKPHRGVVQASPLQHLPEFRPCSTFTCEQMHSGDLGHAKTELKIWFDADRRKPYYIKAPWKLAKLDAFTSSIRLPTLKCTRQNRPLSSFRSWKGSHFKVWTVIESLIILPEVMPSVYVSNWARFVVASYLLLKQEISNDDLMMAQNLLEEHSRASQELYGKTTMTSNLHQTLHWPCCVVKSGPLFCYKANPFEGKFGTIKKDITSTRGTGQQVMERSVIREYFPEIIEKVLVKDSLNKCAQQHFPVALPASSYPLPGVRGAATKTDQAALNPSKYFQFKKFVWQRLPYRTYESQVNTKKNDSCIQLKDGRFGLIHSIYSNVRGELTEVDVSILTTSNLTIAASKFGDKVAFDLLTVPHIFNAKLAHEIISITHEQISLKCILIEHGKKLFVCRPSNFFEVQ